MNLREQILAEIERREAIVAPVHAVAPPGTWETRVDNGKRYVVDGDGDPLALIPHSADVAHVILHDPADALRRYAHYRRVLERHQRDHIYDDQTWSCVRCVDGDCVALPWPCDEITDLAEAVGIEAQS